MCGNTQTTRREYPHNIPSNHRRFKNGAWQRPTRKARGWEPSVGLAGLTYAQGLAQIERLNSIGRDIVDVTGVTANPSPEVSNATQTKVAPVAGDLPTDRNHRRFNTVTGNWEKPTDNMDGWTNSGAAGLSYEKGVERYFHEDNRFGYINIGRFPAEPDAPVQRIDGFTRNWNTSLGIWEKPTSDLTGMRPSSGFAGLGLVEGVRFNRDTHNGLFTLTLDGAPIMPDAENTTANDGQVSVENILDTAIFDALNAGLADVNGAAGEGPFAQPFRPVVSLLPNGGISITADARAAVSLTRAVIATVRNNPASQDSLYLAPLGNVLADDATPLFTDAIVTLGVTPYGE